MICPIHNIQGHLAVCYNTEWQMANMQRIVCVIWNKMVHTHISGRATAAVWTVVFGDGILLRVPCITINHQEKYMEV